MLSNRYIQRRVASSDARACFVCYRPTTNVLVNEVPGADHFFACDSHLSDPGFATIDKASQLAIAEREEQLRKIAALKREWEEVQRKKQQYNAKSTDAKGADAKGTDAKSTEATKPDVNKASSPQEPPALDEPKSIKPAYELNWGVYNLRLSSKKRAAQERRTKAMLETPGLFPEVPKHRPN